MSRADDQAFPTIGHNYTRGGVNWSCEPCNGLTKREYFAAMAMQGMRGLVGGYYGAEERKRQFELTAEWAVEQADALLAELAKGEKS